MEDFIKTVAAYAKIDADDDVTEIIEAAIEKCETETGKKFDLTSQLYKQAVKMIATDWIDHRGATTTESLKELPAPTNVQGILNQIALDAKYEVIA
jgi:hypothetical protein